MKKNSTKRALLTSVFSLALCLVMLLGTTFAWFTDTASTAVNKIVSGKLDVALEMQNADGSWESAEGKTLTFKTADNRAAEDILWEPGATYELPALRVVNNGNLALKYQVKITGITGNAELLKVIDFTVQKGDAAKEALANWEGCLLPAGKTPVNGEEVKESTPFVISGTMQSTAGNDYQDLTINGISITVYATQYTYEQDSTGPNYDKDAAYKGSQVFTGGTHVLNKGGVALATDEMPVAVFATGADTDVTITGGYYDGGRGGDYNVCVWANNGATVTIKDGTFTVGPNKDGDANSVIYSTGGHINIEGGFFYTDSSWNGFYYVLNQQNSNPGTITVTGGTFVNYDPSKGDDNLKGNFVPNGYSVASETKSNGDVWYTVVKTVEHASLENAFDGVDFGYSSTASGPVSIDGKGATTITKWTDAWVSSDTTIKGVTFKKGAAFNASKENITVTLEDCTFYGCDQGELLADNVQRTDNSGDGLCLNVETRDHTGVNFIIKNCRFIGDGGADVTRFSRILVNNSQKARGHAIGLNVSEGSCDDNPILLIEGCTIDNVRGNAIQLYGHTGDITIQDTKINSWGVNKENRDYAVRGDYNVGDQKTITISNVYFGQAENKTSGYEIGHINVGAFPGNTTGTRAAGTYSN